MFESIDITDRLAMGLGAVFYATAFGVGLGVVIFQKNYPRSIMWALLILGFMLQTLGLNLRGAAIRGCPLGNNFELAQFIAWSLILIFFLVGPVFKLRLLSLFTSGLATALAGGSFLILGWDAPYPPGLFGGNPWIELHATLAIFSYAVFALLSLVSVMFLIQRHGLKKKQFKGVYAYLPSVQQLDIIAKRLLITGVIVLSAALIFGAVFWLKNLHLVPVFKLSATCLVWLGYLVVTYLRLRKKLVTRRHAIACLGLFFLALASLWPVQSARDTDEGEIKHSITE